jgi:hypothetical protein
MTRKEIALELAEITLRLARLARAIGDPQTRRQVAETARLVDQMLAASKN